MYKLSYSIIEGNDGKNTTNSPIPLDNSKIVLILYNSEGENNKTKKENREMKKYRAEIVMTVNFEVPDNYADDEDILRSYALANLDSEDAYPRCFNWIEEMEEDE